LERMNDMLSGKNKRYLRSLAVNIDAIFQIGKGGLTDNIISQLDEALEARELVKVKVLEACSQTARELSTELASSLNAELVQVIGRNIVLYRRSVKKPRIELPRV